MGVCSSLSVFIPLSVFTRIDPTVELQWLEHRWLVYHGYFELVLESQGKNPIAEDIIIFGIILGDFLFYIENGMFCVFDEAILMRTHNIPSY